MHKRKERKKLFLIVFFFLDLLSHVMVYHDFLSIFMLVIFIFCLAFPFHIFILLSSLIHFLCNCLMHLFLVCYLPYFLSCLFLLQFLSIFFFIFLFCVSLLFVHFLWLLVFFSIFCLFPSLSNYFLCISFLHSLFVCI